MVFFLSRTPIRALTKNSTFFIISLRAPEVPESQGSYRKPPPQNVHNCCSPKRAPHTGDKLPIPQPPCHTEGGKERTSEFYTFLGTFLPFPSLPLPNLWLQLGLYTQIKPLVTIKYSRFPSHLSTPRL